MADDALSQHLLHLEQLFLLSLEHLADGDAGPLRHDFGDFVGGDFFREQRTLGLQGRQRCFDRAELLLERNEFAVADLGGAFEIAAARGAAEFCVEFFAPLLVLPQICDAVLFVFPARLQAIALPAQLGDFAFDAFQTLGTRRVTLLLERFAFDFELRALAVELIEFFRHGIDLDTHATRGFVHQVDGFVRQKAVADVAIR